MTISAPAWLMACATTLALAPVLVVYAADQPPVDPTHLQDSCRFPHGTVDVGLNSAFYLEKKRVVPLGDLVKKGDALFYVQLAPAAKFAIPVEPIYNRDPSPLNVDFTLEAGTRYRIPFEVTVDRATHYEVVMVPAKTMLFGVDHFVPLRPDGTLCSNMLSWGEQDPEKRRIHKWMKDGGMPRVYQSQPVRFEYAEIPNRNPLSVALVVKDFDAATVTLAMTVLRDGKSVKQEVASYDLLGGSIKVGDLQLDVTKSDEGMKLISITEPDNYSNWLHRQLRVPF